MEKHDREVSHSIGETSKEVRLRRANPEDVPAIVRLMQTSLGQGGTSWSEAYWRWKHEANPFGASPVLVAEADGRLVGVRAFLRWQWQCGSQTVPAVRAVDTVTHPDWRGQGIFTRLTERLVEEMREEGVAFVFNTPNAQSRPGYLKMGWKVVGQYSRWVRPMHFARCFQAVARPESVTPRHEPIGALPTAAALLKAPGLGPFLRALNASRGQSYRTQISREYLRWRYCDIPGRSYRALWDLEEGTPEAGEVLIFRVSDEGRNLRVASTNELLVTPSPSGGWKHTRRLLRGARRRIKADYIAMLPGHRFQDWGPLATDGFIPLLGRGPHFTARVLNVKACPLDPCQRKNWQLSAGELEVL